VQQLVQRCRGAPSAEHFGPQTAQPVATCDAHRRWESQECLPAADPLRRVRGRTLLPFRGSRPKRLRRRSWWRAQRITGNVSALSLPSRSSRVRAPSPASPFQAGNPLTPGFLHLRWSVNVPKRTLFRRARHGVARVHIGGSALGEPPSKTDPHGSASTEPGTAAVSGLCRALPPFAGGSSSRPAGVAAVGGWAYAPPSRRSSASF